MNNRSESKVLIIGKERAYDYVGARTLYLYRTLVDHKVPVEVWDYELMQNDPPIDSTHVIWLPWVQDLNDNYLSFAQMLEGKKFLWTEGYHWYCEIKANLARESTFPVEDVFTRICMSTSEGSQWWNPNGCYESWGCLVHENLVKPAIDVLDQVFVDSYWPREWADGLYTNRDAFDEIAEWAKEELKIELVTQPDRAGLIPSWADHTIRPTTKHEIFIERLSQCVAYVSTHHELLGLTQAEALTAGVPVIAAEEHICRTIQVAKGVYKWKVGAADNSVLSVEQAAANLKDALVQAVQAGRSTEERQAIRKDAIGRYGSEAWWDRVGKRLLGGARYLNIDSIRSLMKKDD